MKPIELLLIFCKKEVEMKNKVKVTIPNSVEETEDGKEMYIYGNNLRPGKLYICIGKKKSEKTKEPLNWNKSIKYIKSIPLYHVVQFYKYCIKVPIKPYST